MLDEHLLRRRSSALHTIQHDGVGTSFYGERSVVIRTRCAHFDVDRLLPVGDLAQLMDLDLQIIRPGPIRVAAGRALVDPFRQRAHLGNARRDLVAEQHATTSRLRPLANDHLDSVRFSEVVEIHAIA